MKCKNCNHLWKQVMTNSIFGIKVKEDKEYGVEFYCVKCGVTKSAWCLNYEAREAEKKLKDINDGKA